MDPLPGPVQEGPELPPGEEELGPLEPLFARGEFAPFLDWTRKKIHAEGSRFRPRALVERVTGSPPSAEPFLRYLEAKYRALYGF